MIETIITLGIVAILLHIEHRLTKIEIKIKEVCGNGDRIN